MRTRVATSLSARAVSVAYFFAIGLRDGRRMIRSARLVDRLLASQLRILRHALHLVLTLGAVRVLLSHLALVERQRRTGTA